MGLSHSDILPWVRRCIDKGHNGEDIHHIRVIYTKGGRYIDEWPIPKLTKAEDVSKAIVEAIDRDGKGLGGVHRYTIECYFGDAIIAEKTLPITVQYPRANGNGELDAVEDADQNGITQMLMRHQEALAVTYIGGTRSVIEEKDATIADLRDQVTELRTRIRELEGDRDKQAEERERLASAAHIRAMQFRKMLWNEKVKEEAIEFLAPMAPMALNHMFGQKILPETTTPTEQMLRAVVATLEPDQFHAIMSALKPPQQAAMLQIVNIFQRRASASEEKMKNKGAPSTDPNTVVPPPSPQGGSRPDVKVTSG